MLEWCDMVVYENSDLNQVVMEFSHSITTSFFIFS